MQSPYHSVNNLIRTVSSVGNAESRPQNSTFIKKPKNMEKPSVYETPEATNRTISSAFPQSIPYPGKGRYALIFAVLMAILVTAGSFAVELNVARQGEIRNVPVESPYNGCLLVREGPNMESPVKGHVTNGSTVQIEAASGSWYKISAPLSGYIWASYVKVTDSQTVDTGNMTKALDLETIVENANPWTREENLPARQKLVEENDTATPPELPAAP